MTRDTVELETPASFATFANDIFHTSKPNCHYLHTTRKSQWKLHPSFR